jgi:glycosyltransferase involved in cell wall biosynthesis
MKKLLFLSESLSGGGAEKVLVTLLKNLDQTKFEITLCCVVDSSPYVDEVKPYVRYKRFLPNPTNLKGLSLYTYKFIYKCIYQWLPIWLVYSLFLPHDSDVEIAFVEGYATKLLAHSTNKKAKKIACVHTDLNTIHWTQSVFPSKAQETRSYNEYDVIVAVSNSVKNAFHQCFPLVKQPVVTIYNAIDSSTIWEMSKEEFTDSGDNSFRIVAVGRLVQQKAFDRLLHVVSKLKRDGFLIKLWLLGDGEQRNYLEQIIKEEQIEDMVTLWGFQTNPYKYMSKCDLFVCSSIVEGYSTAVTEAIILGIPVVTTNCAGMGELLSDGEFGIITDDPEEGLYKSIRALIVNSDLLEKYKKKAEERGQCFVIANSMKPIENLFVDV